MEKFRGTVGICGAGQIGAAASVAFQRAGYRPWYGCGVPR